MRSQVGSIVLVAYGLLACLPSGGAWSEVAPKATSREYKIRLRAADLADETARTRFWRTVADRTKDSAAEDQGLHEKPCRRVSYFDTASLDLEKTGWFVRRREEFRDIRCSVPTAVRVETTLKVRGRMAVTQVVRGERWAARAKVEEDRLVGRGSSNPSTMLSVSATADGQAALSKVTDVRMLFEGALPNFDADVELSASCRVVLERRWEFKKIDLPKGIDHPELTLWYWSLEDSAVPWLAELSFSVKLNDLEAVKAADKLEARLVHQLADKLDKPGSKTAAAYDCDRR
jgi:hypothetical protein